MSNWEVERMQETTRQAKLVRNIIAMVILFLLALIGGGMFGCPRYNVWQQGLQGKAELARAEQNRMIKIEEAKALKESAQMLADAEIIRARGVAGANKIIGESLHGEIGQAYLRYLWIDSLKNGANERIYIPTEAGLPILEARPSSK